jgi:hypothetical protein
MNNYAADKGTNSDCTNLPHPQKGKFVMYLSVLSAAVFAWEIVPVHIIIITQFFILQ